MAVLNFTLSEAGVAVFHDALSCIVKFNDDVSLEARKDKLTLTTLNLTKSAYVKVTFAANRFFSRYSFEGTQQSRDKFFCVLFIKSLISVFRARQGGDSVRDRDRETTIEHCDVTIEDGAGIKSRLTVKLYFRNGITASHALPFEVRPPTHAKFVEEETTSRWAISSRTLRQLMDHFGPGIELLDINTDDESRVANFTCFTEKVAKTSTNNEEVLKKPLHTSITVDMEEFDEMDVQEKLHIIISVKDFRSVLQHAQTTSGRLSACYSGPGRPMKLSYNSDGIMCEFVLMTVGERDANAQKARKARAPSKTPRPALEQASNRDTPAGTANRPRTQEPAALEPPKQQQQQHQVPAASRPRQSLFEIRPEPLPIPAAPRSPGLFVSQHDEYDDERNWAPVNPDEDEEDETNNPRLEWDASNLPNPSMMRISDHLPTQAAPRNEDQFQLSAGLEPTQFLAEVRRYGLFSQD